MDIKKIRPDKILSKNIIKKEKKRAALLDSAFELFTTVGIGKTTINAISKGAGVGKGTFYLYFKDKEDIQHALIVKHSKQVLTDAINALQKDSSYAEMSLIDKIIFITDFIISYMNEHQDHLQVLAKHFNQGLIEGLSEDVPDDGEFANLRSYITDLLTGEGLSTDELKLPIFTILEMLNSTCYHVILNSKPVTLEEYKPYLFHSIRVLIEDALENKAGGTLV